MDEIFKLDIIYKNNLETDKFAQMFSNKSQCYKFYWFEAILNLLPQLECEITFEQIIDEMICGAWHTVTHYHLRLGPTINGKAENFLEHAIIVLNQNSSELGQNPTKEKIKIAIKKCQEELREDKKRLADYVPHRLLYPFFDTEELKEGLDYIKNDKRKRLMCYMNNLSKDKNIFYTILDGVGLQKKIRINQYWREFVLNNYSVIQSWVQYNKVQFLQDRNPGVPGIINKLFKEEEKDKIRKLEEVRELWKVISEVTETPLNEIYTGNDISVHNLSIDHFVPRSYISNDELWNLIPMDKNLNSEKNNRLPLWDKYFGLFAHYQYCMYNLVFNNAQKNDKVVNQFNKCRKNNLNSLLASEILYIPGHTEIEFSNILCNHLKPIYESARLQGYAIWKK